MEQSKVPQDNIATHCPSTTKAIYATDNAGKYRVVRSSGWEVEEEATMQAVYEFNRLAKDAYTQVQTGSKSPLYYHMYAQRMGLHLLSESTGIFQWRIKRHFRPSVFPKLSKKILERYSSALGLSINELGKLPKQYGNKAGK